MSSAQNLSMGMSYFFPINAPMVVSVPPISLRGQLTGGEYWSFELGLTWYRLGGLAAEGLPFSLDKALTDPFDSFVIPAQIGGKIPVSGITIEPKFGVFIALNGTYDVRQDHLADALVAWSPDWRAMQTDAEIGQSNTFGIMGSLFVQIPLNDQLELACGASWIEGSSPAPITGNAVAVSQNDVPVDLALDLPDATLDYRGFELNLGIEFKLR